ncbi:hypothetical protein M409DRAFT_59734 [Zasmidium cellare ATCC 36951]|uniref:Uncharacterized protein n=1 Tax=Zasmidium cellare ATCC 36951 TaxID=1080233 RepID=A0A6A6C4B9_ZASCE|nr:uncharacterized protein M409DRAFT_59734 [Zasmidium cellare ATCC 36951]KAF2160702.1 hypothetical protein M409DRAFT_59734 [Zasmidium cellare ATCC 36951]
MPPTRHNPHDPFVTTSTASNTGLRTQASQQSLRSTASAASTSNSRTRQPQRDQLFAPSLSRRPTSRTRVEDEVLADSSSEQERRSRRLRPQHKSRQQQVEEQEIVKRDAQGNYLLGGSELGVAGGVPAVKPLVQEDEDEVRMEELNAYYSALAKKYFTSGAAMTTTRRIDEDYERDRPDMMYCLKAEVIQKLESEKWLYEHVDRFQSAFERTPREMQHCRMTTMYSFRTTPASNSDPRTAYMSHSHQPIASKRQKAGTFMRHSHVSRCSGFWDDSTVPETLSSNERKSQLLLVVTPFLFPTIKSKYTKSSWLSARISLVMDRGGRGFSSQQGCTLSTRPQSRLGFMTSKSYRDGWHAVPGGRCPLACNLGAGKEAGARVCEGLGFCDEVGTPWSAMLPNDISSCTQAAEALCCNPTSKRSLCRRDKMLLMLTHKKPAPHSVSLGCGDMRAWEMTRLRGQRGRRKQMPEPASTQQKAGPHGATHTLASVLTGKRERKRLRSWAGGGFIFVSVASPSSKPWRGQQQHEL